MTAHGWRKVQRSGARPRKGVLWLGFQDRAWQKTLPLPRSQPAPGPPRVRRGSQRRSAGGGPSGELVSEPKNWACTHKPTAKS